MRKQPIPPVDSLLLCSTRYITESDPKEDPEEYEDDKTKDGPVDYPMDGGDDGDDDDDDSFGDDVDDEDEDDDEEEEKEEEHLAPVDSAIVVLTDEPEEILGYGARPYLYISSPPPVPFTLLPSPGCQPNLNRDTQDSILSRAYCVVTAHFHHHSTTHLVPPSLYIPPPVDHRDGLPESELPPRKRLCLSTLGSRYEIEESSTARPTRDRGGYLGRSAREEAVPEGAHNDRWDEVNTRVTELAELHEHDTQDLYALLEDAQDSRRQYGLWRMRPMLLERLGLTYRIESGDPSGASDPS
ncbi:hypothetical protein Tco_0566958 [Tanacetum coccineum]